MQLTLPQTEIFLSTARFKSVVAGRRFGKTYLSTIELINAAISGKNKNCWYIAPTYGAAKEIAWDMLIKNIPEQYIVKTNETGLTIKLINGSVISLKGAERSAVLRGRSLDHCILDEFSEMRPEVWFEVIRPSLSDREGSALFIGTPKGRNHFYDLWAKGIDGADNWHSFQYTTLQGGNVSAPEVEQARADLDERTFNQEYCAEFVTYSGLIYYNFDRALSVIKAEDDGTSTILCGMDFNVSPMTSIQMIRKGSDLIVIDECIIYGSNTQEMADELHLRYPSRHICVFPDPACRQRRTSAAGKTDLSILQNNNFETKVRKSHTPVRDRINSVNSRLKTGDGKRHLFISDKCKQTIKSLERQTYKEGTSQPDKDGGYDHLNDALGYALDYLFPVKTDYQIEQPTRWT
ncbi:MAG: hypothetical protein ACI9W7_000963 [Porticoccaceae bacterium]